MSVRKPLQQQLIEAWQLSIENDYCNQRINSERSLQASFWSHLNRTLPSNTRRMFIEPRFSVTVKRQRKRFYPDIVICNTKEVIAVVEIKYQPRVLPSYRKDLETLRILATHRKQKHIYATNVRYRGYDVDARKYMFSNHVLFVWAGVHCPPTESYESSHVPLLSNGLKNLEGCFLQLHAETDPKKPPNVFARSG